MTVRPFRDDLGWRWQIFAGRWVLVTDGGGAQVVLSAKNHSYLQTRDTETGMLRDIAPTDRVAKMLEAAPDVHRHARALIHGIDIGLFRIEADGDEKIADGVLTELRAALAKSGGT